MLLSSFTHPHHHMSLASLAPEVWSTFVSFRKCSPNNSGKWLILYDLCLQPKNWLVPHLEEKFFLKAADKKMAVVYHISSIARVVPSISVIR